MSSRHFLRQWIFAWALATCVAPAFTQTAPPAAAFQNPLLPSGADPWVIADGRFYYFMATTGSNLTIRRTRDMAKLADADVKVVWTPPDAGPYSKQIWAPELHKLNGRWYIYFAADDGNNANHRIYVLENAAANPLEGEWTLKGKVATLPTNGLSTRRSSRHADSNTWSGQDGRATWMASSVFTLRACVTRGQSIRRGPS